MLMFQDGGGGGSDRATYLEKLWLLLSNHVVTWWYRQMYLHSTQSELAGAGGTHSLQLADSSHHCLSDGRRAMRVYLHHILPCPFFLLETTL